MHTLRQNFKKSRGVSLVESLIALFVAGFILFNIWAAYIQSKSVVKVSLHEMEALTYGASFLAQAQRFHSSLLIDASRSPLTPSSIDASGTAVFSLSPGCGFTIPLVQKGVFTFEYEITKINTSLSQPTKLLSFWVSWQEVGEKPRDAVFTSLCTDE